MLSIVYITLYFDGINMLSAYDLMEDIYNDMILTTYSLFTILAIINLSFVIMFYIALLTSFIMKCYERFSNQVEKKAK